MTQPSSPLSCDRTYFDIPQDITYYNCAYLSPMCHPVHEAGIAALNREARPWTIKPDDFYEDSEVVRGLFASLIGTESRNVALIPSVSYGINVAAQVIEPGQGRRILLLDEQFPSNVYPWREAVKRTGAHIVHVPRPQNGDWTRAILDHLDERVAVASMPHCHWTDGSLVDLELVSDRCRELGIPLVLDVTQSLGAMPLNLDRIRPAFLVAAGYKWLLGPYSTAYLYADPRYQDGPQLDPNWMTRKDSRNFAELVNYRDELEPGALRYDVGQRSKFILLPMAIAAFRQIMSWGVANIGQALGAYNRELREGARSLGFETLPDKYAAPHLMGLRHPEGIPVELVRAFQERQIVVSVRGNAIRVAPHLYNDAEDRRRFLETAASCLG
ncbi:Aminotransferase class V-fold PLP-dependent enzyme [Sulfidibacter corallicola]|uniref:Aminotransferase class V-fold PLP-dependent enzyme n=1 Tax=Sulfidibacter corallicola TaxID=2818388 RepID=A0A8A4TJ68_SULCO|nr:aminotransferase class V-fold PLP-dependent enzyme [Sulfidibacter corallicola]QTD49966.1 aminotransferase class V-fold PLP-dependent enzyme [Sulfidibacter corallicola]